MAGGLWPTFRRNVILVPSGTFSSETSVRLHQTTLCDVPHNYNTDIYRCKNLKYRTQLKSPSLPKQFTPVNTILTQFNLLPVVTTYFTQIHINVIPHFINISVRFITKTTAEDPVLHFTTPFFTCY